MRTIQQGLGAGNTENGDAQIDRCTGSNENLDANCNESLDGNCTEMTGTSAYLPEPKRWVAHRKAEVVAAVRGGFVSLDEARKRYALSMEEYLTWEREIDRLGLPGLRVNKTQQRRRVRPRFRDY